MNFIEAWKAAKIGQKIRRKIWSIDYVSVKKHEEGWSCNGPYLEGGSRFYFSSKDTLADDWEVMREKKSICVDVEWIKQDGYVFPRKVIGALNELLDGGWNSFIGKTTKMTLEWEE